MSAKVPPRVLRELAREREQARKLTRNRALGDMADARRERRHARAQARIAQIEAAYPVGDEGREAA